MSVGPRAGKFDILSNDHGRTHEHTKLRFFCFRPEIPFLNKVSPKIKILSLSWNLVARLIRICRIQCAMVIFTFSVLHRKYPFWANLVPKFKIVSLSWNLPRLIRICRIHRRCSFFSVLNRKYPFRANFLHKVNIVSLSWNLVPKLIRICKIQWWYSLLLF